MLAGAIWEKLGGTTIGLHLGMEDSTIDVTLPDGRTRLTQEELGKRVEAIRKASEKYDHVCFAIGQCYEECRFNVRQALRLADERMYEDKRKFYEAHPELKR